MILALTAASDATAALDQAIDHIAPATLYADLSTASAGLKQQLAAISRRARPPLRRRRADDDRRQPRPAHPGARVRDRARRATRSYSAVLGVPVEAIGDEAGLAATRKLLRSVVIKGLAALLIEAMRAGERRARPTGSGGTSSTS